MPKNCFRMKYDLRMEEAAKEAEILVYGDIVQYKWEDSDVSARDFDQMLKKAKAEGAEKLTLRINSPGGSVYQAVAMRAMLMSCGMDVEVRIEGLCASAATLLACVPDTHVSIAKGSEYMIHNPWTIVLGNANEIEKEAQHLRQMEGELRAFYADRSGKSEEEIQSLMDAETWFTSEDAVKQGFCDEVTGTDAAASASAEALELMREMYMRVPQEITVCNTASGTLPAGAGTENTPEPEKEDTMDIREITMQMLESENNELYTQILAQGAAAERERITEIDDLTPAGYEAMAAQAKAAGTSALDYHKQIIKAQKEKAAEFLASRREETEPAQQVKGAAAEDRTDADEYKQFAAEMKEAAEGIRANAGGMY